MKTRTWQSKHFYGNKISDYGIEQGYLDYGTLSKAFESVLVNNITALFYSNLNTDFIEPELVNGSIDNSEQIQALEDVKTSIEDNFDILCETMGKTTIEEQIDRIIEQKEDLLREEEEQPEVYQYYIVSSNGAEIIKEFTDDPLYYIEILDMYIWGITHWGTSWDYVLTDVKLEEDNDNE